MSPNSMLSSQCISITELKKEPSKHIKLLKKDGHKVIFKNNKPVAVLVDIDNFDLSIEEPFGTLHPLEFTSLSPSSQQAYHDVMNLKDDEFISYTA